MENPIYIALSRQDALRRQMDVVANNLANMTTPAYKNQRMMFLEYLAKPAATPVEKISMVQDYGVLRNTAVGPISSTGNPLDVALQGDGYLTVETRDGQRFTRNGRLQLDLDRQIVDTNGLPVLNEQDLPMTVPQNSGPVTIAADGTVSSDQGQIGRIKLVRFEREQFMTELGGGIYTTDEPPLPVLEILPILMLVGTVALLTIGAEPALRYLDRTADALTRNQVYIGGVMTAPPVGPDPS